MVLVPGIEILVHETIRTGQDDCLVRCDVVDIIEQRTGNRGVCSGVTVIKLFNSDFWFNELQEPGFVNSSFGKKFFSNKHIPDSQYFITTLSTEILHALEFSEGKLFHES